MQQTIIVMTPPSKPPLTIIAIAMGNGTRNLLFLSFAPCLGSPSGVGDVSIVLMVEGTCVEGPSVT